MKKRIETRAFPKRWLELEPECGITQLSLRNLTSILNKKVKLIAICLLWDTNSGRYYTKAYFEPRKGRSTVYFHVFTGFSVGGEGSRGLNVLMKMFSGPWTIEYSRRGESMLTKTIVLKGYESHVRRYSVNPVNILSYNRFWERERA